MTGVSFEDLVTAATVGVSRRPLRIGALDEPAAGRAGILDGSDPAAALLDAAALLAAGRRAGWRAVRDVTIPAAARDDGAPELSTRAARLLAQVARSDADTLADLLAAAGKAGYLAPAPLLPTLLDAARAKAPRPAIAAVLGPRGRWLAAQRPEWRTMADAGAQDPPAATEKPPEEFTQRAVLRARAVLRLERDGSRAFLAATLPDSLDDDWARDGIPPRPPGPGIGTGAWLLIHVVAAAPLRSWETMFGRSARQIAGLPVADGLALPTPGGTTPPYPSEALAIAVHAGWRLAAIRQRDAAWAAALLEQGPGSPPPEVRGLSDVPWAEDYQLAAALPPQARAERAAGLLTAAAARLTRPAASRGDAAAAIVEVASCPGPWPDVLADAFIAMLSRTVSPAARPGWPRELMLTAGRKLPVTGPVDYAARLTRLADTRDCPAPWAAVLSRTAETIALRRAFYEEIR